ncbi:MAG: energy transducer TonB [Bacteroidota bacterium]
MWNGLQPWDRHRPIALKFGMLCSLGLVFMAFSIRSNYTVEAMASAPDIIDDEVEVIRTKQEEKKFVAPPPVPPKATSEVIEAPDFKDPDPEPVIERPVETPKAIVSTFVEPVLPDPKPIVKAKPAPKVEAPKFEEVDTPILFPSRMPVFGECDAQEKDIRDACSKKKLLKYVYDHIKYPRLALDNGVGGNVVARFVIDKKGVVTDIEILRDFGMGSKEAVTKVLENMPLWEPGRQNGRKVKVIMTLPVRFHPK